MISAPTLRMTASWARTDRFWLAWPNATGERDRDATTRDDCVSLVHLLSAYAPVTMVADPAELVQCSLLMPQGVCAMAAPAAGAFLNAPPVWLSAADGRVLAGVAQGARSGLDWARAAQLDVVELPAGWQADLIETDGEGTALVSARLAASLPGGRPQAEQVLAERLGIVQVIWLNDPGSGPIPARYLAPGVVAVPLPGSGEAAHPAFAALSANRDLLRMASDRTGRPFSVIDMPRPSRQNGSYSDCVVAGDLVVVPEFEEGRDARAFAQVAAALPGARVVAFPATHLAGPGGGLGQRILAQPKPS